MSDAGSRGGTPAARPLPPLGAIPPQIACVEDYEPFARDRMTAQAFAYVAGGAADEITVRRNREAFARLQLTTRVLRDLAGGHTRLTLLGEPLDYPILLAPVALQRLAHADGELATALAASAMRAAMAVSCQASTLLEDVARAASTPLWLQLYLQGDRAHTLELVRRAEACGYRALLLTVDAAISGPRNREQRAEFSLPAGVAPVNLASQRTPTAATARPGESPVFGSPLLAAAPTWRDIDWLRTQTSLPIVLKGVMSGADAVRAAEHGAAAVVVSNHGGRTLDSQPATIEVLESVAQALGGRAPVLLDGGVRRGTDVLKALALGASAVLIGRPYVFALAAAGASGVAHVLHLLRTELEMAMVATGCRTLADIGPEIVRKPTW